MATDEPGFDYVVVGGGSAGAVLAARLSEDADVRVLLLEAGRARHPLAFMPVSYALLIDRPGANWCYRSEPEPGTRQRSIPVPRGKMLGGSSSINGLVYVRGQREDYDEWAGAGNPGWGWQDVEPLFRRLEDYPSGDPAWRGHGGPLRLSEVSESNPLYDALFAAACSCGFDANPDYNGPRQEGMGRVQASVAAGRRMSTDHCYLRPALGRPNLQVLTEASVQQLLLRKGACRGVRYRRHGVVHEVAARREVVLCAGAIGSPQILELSGIGSPAVLAAAGIPVTHALPAVGEHLRDHLMGRMKWRLQVAEVSHNNRVRGLRGLREVLRYLAGGGGYLGQPGAAVLGFLRTRPELARPDVQLTFAPIVVKNPKKRQLEDFPGMTMGCYQLRPRSMGSVHVRSSDADRPPAIRFNFLDDPLDRRTLAEGMQLARRIVECAALDAYRGEELFPGPGVRSTEELVTHLRQCAETAFHPIGTCRMGPGEDAVVDASLRVHGIANLRVADASIMPTMPSGNTNAASIMIGEKAHALLCGARPRESTRQDTPGGRVHALAA